MMRRTHCRREDDRRSVDKSHCECSTPMRKVRGTHLGGDFPTRPQVEHRTHEGAAMHESTTIRRMSARTAAAVLLAVVGMLALGGAWTSAIADPGNGNGANQTGPYDPTDVCGGTNQ